MRILPLTIAATVQVALAMRAADRAEIFATRWSADAGELAVEVCALSKVGAVLADEQVAPIMAVGAIEIWPGVWSVWAFATDCFGEIAIGATRYVRRQMIPALLERGAHRAECRSAASHLAAHRWLELLGARIESRHAGFGKGGEDFVSFVWRREHVRV